VPNNYIYRMKRDTGFAPNVEYDICTLSGCKNRKDGKRRNIEELAVKGSWVIGIGGNKTGKPDKLIYAMEVEENLPYSEFKKRYPQKHDEYLRQMKLGRKHGENVLVSIKFYYFGNNAIDLPNELSHIIIKGQGFRQKGITDEVVSRMKKHIEECGYRNYGVFGKPCNVEVSC